MASAGKSVHKLFVHNLPWTTNTQKLKNYFSKFGNLTNANVVFDKNTGISRGYGFIVFSNQAEFELVQQGKHILDGSVINIEPMSS